jgi:Mg-chelatase subunit ChlD
LFKRRLEADGIDSAVVIMLDVSGSMFYERRVRDDNGNEILDPDTGTPKRDDYIRHALKTCAALVDTLNRAQVKVSIVTFGTDVSVLKPFDMSARRGLEELARVKEGGQTNDYTALRYCHELLNSRREARRVVFVITDGEGDCEMTRAQVDAGANLKITTVGIGIDIDVSGTYPQSVKVSGRDVGAASFKQIRLAA